MSGNNPRPESVENNQNDEQETRGEAGEEEAREGSSAMGRERDWRETRWSQPRTVLVGGEMVFCLVCNMNTGPPGSAFIKPCRCGYWVHDLCLIIVALRFEEANPSARSIGCKICRRAYNISPVKSSLLRYAARFSNDWYQTFCHMCMESFLQLAADITFIKLGSVVFKKIYGSEEAERLISLMTPLGAIFTCQLIPVASIVITNIAWEQNCLNFLRKCSRLPLVGGVFPAEYRDIADIYKIEPTSFWLVGGLLLPFYALAASRLFTFTVQDPFHRFLLGGAAVVLFKGVCKMYYTHKKYVHFCTFTIVDANSPNM